MFFGTINRMILAELVKVFLLSLVGLTGLFLLGGLIQEADQKGLSPTQVVRAIPLILPNTLPFTIPATTLFATCVVYGRMSADNEVLVLRAAGVDIYHLIWPALFLGIGTTASTAALYYDTIPRSQGLLRQQLLKDGEGILYGMIKREGGLSQSNLDFVLFVRDVQGRDLIDVVVKKRKADKTGFELVARAQTAKLRIRKIAVQDSPYENLPRPGGKGELVPKVAAVERFERRRTATGPDRFELVVLMDRCYVDSLNGETVADLQNQEFTSPLPGSIFGKPTEERPSAQTWVELMANRQQLQAKLTDLDGEIRDLLDAPDARTVAGRTNAQVAAEYLAYTQPKFKRMLREVDVEVQMRPALAFGCLCFVLIGCPVGIWASQSDYLSVFIICFMPTVFVYYPLLLASLNLAKESKVPPVAAWAPDAIGAVAAIILIKRLMKPEVNRTRLPIAES